MVGSPVFVGYFTGYQVAPRSGVYAPQFMHCKPEETLIISWAQQDLPVSHVPPWVFFFGIVADCSSIFSSFSTE
jgi:hypothetical protein